MCSRTLSLLVMRGLIGVFHGVRAVRFPHVGLSACFGQRTANCSQEGALGQWDKGPFFPHRLLDLGLCPHALRSWESSSDPRLKTSGPYSVACRECSQTSSDRAPKQASLRSALFREDCLSPVE
jgi:hypothetical protein